VDATGKTVFAANYGSGSIVGIPILPDGQLGQMTAFIQHGGKSVDAERQSSPHAHCVTLDPANHFLFACDLGIDKVMIYKFRPEHGALARSEPPSVSLKPGTGPRHLAFHPNGREAYVINELNSTITRFGYDADHGVLTEEQTISTVPVDFKGTNYPAEITVHPFGKFLYGSNRGHDSIAIFAIDAATGALKPVAYESTRGKYPRYFAIDPTGTFLLAANQDSNNIVIFRIDPATGLLKATGQTVDIGAPACIRFLCNP
jgi:6-phosphogluconolactonase